MAKSNFMPFTPKANDNDNGPIPMETRNYNFEHNITSTLFARFCTA